jgi:NAD(P)-dependent dehydrogenase (short-subunit alcohol dehydrogenase family)
MTSNVPSVNEGRQTAGIVTGAGGGIGRAIAIAFADSGARILVADVDEAGGNGTVAMIRDAGGDATFLQVNVALEAQVEAMAAFAVDRFGTIDFAINNAGIEGEGDRIDDNDEAVFDRLMGVNVKGVFLCMKHEIRQMRRQRSGAIVNLGSVNSFRTVPGTALYTTTKHAVIGLTKSAAIDCAADGIRINAICPGAIDTPMLRSGFDRLPIPSEELIPQFSLINRLGRPEEIAKAALWLCSDDASFTYGHALAVDGGYLAR